ncbi:MAG: hypothetical protein JRF61_09130 [Deltaproteobacteria bacterium]|nr:hypothetical protein [Deltaproteobacteria bacterium]
MRADVLPELHRAATAIFLLLTVLRCGGRRVALTPEAIASVDTIAVAQVADPPSYLIQHHGGSGSYFPGRD